MTLRLRVHVDEDGNAVVPVGKAFVGEDVVISYEVTTPELPRLLPKPPRSRVRPPRIRMTGEEHRAFLDSLYGSYPEPIPEPPDPPTTPEDVV
jgi:hypothetical protein